jgi:two-component system sensor histidine kinase/response regulator
MVSYCPRLGLRWQLIAFILTTGVTAISTVVAIGHETGDQFFVDLLVLSLGVTSLLPWTVAWQAAANTLMLLGLAAFALLSPATDPLLCIHWLALVAGAGIRQSCAIYGVRYRRQIAHDIEALQRSERELIAAREAALAASNAKSEFLSSMSHEIRTPLNAVLGMAEVLAETDLNSEQRRYLNTIINSGNALLELINGILDLAKVESGTISLEPIPFSPREVVEQVLETLAIRAHKKRLELIGQIDPDIPEVVEGDPFRLRQILMNLVGNAVKFTEIGQVLIRLKADPEISGLLRFEVSDTGVGIPADKLDLVFEPFSQADSSTSRRYGGTGLGLAIVARLVALMGGQIALESAPGVGSVFRFNVRFPILQRTVLAQGQLPDFSGRKILVVDDIEASREAVRIFLAERHANVSLADSGIKAIELIRETCNRSTPFDAIVLDGFMPGVDCHQVLEQAAHAVNRFVVMLPIGAPKPSTLDALNVGAYVVKPVKRRELIDAIAAVIGQPGTRDLVELKISDHGNGLHSQPQLRILFADDSPDNRELIRAYMKSSPHLIDFAEDGKEAIRKFKEKHYNIVFMDIQMPTVDGYVAVREIRRWENELKRYPTPVVALTASADADAVRRGKDAGFDLHLSKPLKKAALLQTISRYSVLVPATPALTVGERERVALS